MRSEFWWFAPIWMALMIAVHTIEPSFITTGVQQHLSTLQIITLFLVFLLLPVFAAMTRRIRDAGIPTHVMFLVPIYLVTAPFIVVLVDRSRQFGPVPPIRLMPEALNGLLGYFGLVMVVMIPSLLRTQMTFSAQNSNEVPQ
jgi:uncharacterized membrane protein YhaH (DUF805 family)